MISDIFSVADEAFSLVMFYNEFDVCEGANTNTKENSHKKKLSDSNGGRKNGWTEEGRSCSVSCGKRKKNLWDQPVIGRGAGDIDWKQIVRENRWWRMRWMYNIKQQQ